MNNSDELPPDHFWDSEKAEKKYYEVEKWIEEAEHQAQAAAIHYHSESIFALIFARADAKAGENALHPWWIPPDGWFSSEWVGSPLSSVSEQIGYSLTLSETKMVPVETFYAYKSSFGGFREKLVKYVTFRRYEWYTLTDKAAMSRLEWVLRYGHDLAPSKMTVDPELAQPPFRAEEDVKAATTIALSRRDELIEEVQSSLPKARKCRFMPMLPPEIKEASLVPDLPKGLPERSEPDYYPKPTGSPEVRQLPKSQEASFVPNLKPGDSILECIPGSPMPPLKIGKRWADPHWMGKGIWAMYELLGTEEWELRLKNRFYEKVIAAMQTVYEALDKLDQLRRLQKAIRILHYKPVAYKAFWSVLQATEE